MITDTYYCIALKNVLMQIFVNYRKNVSKEVFILRHQKLVEIPKEYQKELPPLRIFYRNVKLKWTESLVLWHLEIIISVILNVKTCVHFLKHL